ncbi:hypothetical protein ILUMI_08598, partial [Ignelater luminosus]
AKVRLISSYVVCTSKVELSFLAVCSSFTKGTTFVVDVTWLGNEGAQSITANLNVPYIRIDLSISPALNLLDKYLNLRNITDVVVIFENARFIDQALYYWINSTRLRMIVSDKLDKISANRLKDMRPMPTSYAIIASTINITAMLNVANQENLMKFPERWNLVFLDFKYENFIKNLKVNKINLLRMENVVCCALQGLSTCNCPNDFNLQKSFLKLMMEQIIQTLARMSNYKLSEEIVCDTNKYNESIIQRFKKMFLRAYSDNGNIVEKDGIFRMKIKAVVEIGTGLTNPEVAGKFDNNQELIIEDGVEIKPIKAFYRVGSTHAIPWSYQEKDSTTGDLRWTGYCIDFIQKLSELMNFNYELVIPENGTFGEKNSEGVWNGLIGDLTRGETDLAISALIMTADREEVVDFVAPYFEQGGISIDKYSVNMYFRIPFLFVVMRKPVRKTSLFKFMTVLKLEVWLSIVAALVVTAFMIWFLDKYSPYSAKNNKKAYPYECR